MYGRKPTAREIEQAGLQLKLALKQIEALKGIVDTVGAFEVRIESLESQLKMVHKRLDKFTLKKQGVKPCKGGNTIVQQSGV